MRFTRLFHFTIACIALAAAAIDRTIESALRWLIQTISVVRMPEQPRLAATHDFGVSLDPSLMQGLRHEAGVPRRGAHRNI